MKSQILAVLERSGWSVRTDDDWVIAKHGSKRERDPAVADKVTMTGRKRRLPIQLYYMIALTCKEGYPWQCDEFSISDSRHGNSCAESFWVSSRFQWLLQASLPSTRTDIPVREIQQQSGDRSSENVELAVLQKVPA